MLPEFATVLAGTLIGIVILREVVTRSLRALMLVAAFTASALLVLQLPTPLAVIGAIGLLVAPLGIARFSERSVSSLSMPDWEYHDLIRRTRDDLHRPGGDLSVRVKEAEGALQKVPAPASEWTPVRNEMMVQLALVRQHLGGEGGVESVDAVSSRLRLMSAWRHAIRARGHFIR